MYYLCIRLQINISVPFCSVLLASQSLYPIIVYSVGYYRLYLSHFNWANM